MLDYSREFVVLASLLHFEKAANELNMSQSSLSRHITSLEKELGFELFFRNPLTLTPAGRHYVESIIDIMGRLKAAISEGRQIAEGGGVALSISMIASNNVGCSIVYESIGRMSDEIPGFSPRLFTSRKMTIFESVQSGNADVGLVFEHTEDLPPDIMRDPLIAYPFFVWAHKDNPVLKNQPVRFKDFESCSIVGSTCRHFEGWLEGSLSVCRKNGFEPRYILKDIDEVTGFLLDLKVNEIVLGSGISDTVCLFNPNVVGVRLTEPLELGTISLIYKSKNKDSTVAKFVNTCHEIADEYREKLIENPTGYLKNSTVGK